MDKAIKYVLKTWYEPDHPLHLDPLHPAIGLAGEAGELLDLYKKERFKDRVSWWDCTCEHRKHDEKCNGTLPYDNSHIACACKIYTPKILDELGDLWYYLRIIIYQFDLPIATPILQTSQPKLEVILSELNTECALFLNAQVVGITEKDKKIAMFDGINYYFHLLLREVDCTLDKLTELNYAKLKDGDNHGWKSARTLS